MKKQVLSLFAIAALAVTAYAQPNSGFETWSTSFGEDIQPTGWVSYNVFTQSFIDPGNTNPTSVFQAPSPDNYQGTYSAKITTIDLVTNPSSTTIPNRGGYLMVGAVQLSAPYLRAGYAATYRPASFSYAAKYTPVNGDTAFAMVMLSKWNGTSRDTIAIGYDYMPAAIAAYTVRNINLIYDAAFSTTIPDTAQIFFSASGLFAPQVGSAVWVDALAFTGWVGVDESAMNTGVDVYPNPSSTVTNFDVVSEDAYQVVINDLAGREVNRLMISNKKAKLDSYLLPAGIYTYSVVTKENEVMSRGKFSVAQ